MKAGSGFIRFLRGRPVLGAMAVSLLACSITLQGAPPSTRGVGRGGSIDPALINSGRSIPISAIPQGVGVRAVTPDVARREMGDAFFLMGTVDTGDVGTATGGPTGCELDDECDDCNSCTDDTCDAVSGDCVFEPIDFCTACDDGLFCNGIDKCDATGNCLTPANVKEWLCVGGDADGLACFNAGDTEGVCGTGICQLFSPNPDPCRLFPDLLCDEQEPTGVNQTGACVNFCDTNADCDDGIACNGVETCVKEGTVGNGGFCIGGGNAGGVCATSADCGGEVCGGVCRSAPNRLCGDAWTGGYVATCEEPGVCTGTFGRCCTPAGNDWACSRTSPDDCRGAGELWLAIGDLPQTESDDGALPLDGSCIEEADTGFSLPGDTFLCPKYSAAIISGTIDGVIGVAGAAACYDHWEIGDDYKMSNCKGDPNDPNDPLNSWYEVLSVRWIGGHVRGFGSRMRVTFYDFNGNFIEDRITSPAFPGGVAKNTVVFDQKPVVPCQGFITIKPAVSFSPDNKVQWAFTIASAQVGSSDGNIWGRKHGVCVTNTGTSCNTDDDCPAADTCNITSSVSAIDGAQEKVAPLEIIGQGTLALEIAGRKVPVPKGACCSLVSGICTSELPWVCEAQGNFFQGPDTKCNICSSDLFTDCDEASDCFVCIGGDFDGELCVTNADCDGGTCDTTPFCLPSPPACQVSACCGDTDGSCVTVTGNLCVDAQGNPSGQGVCVNDAQCAPNNCRIASGTCVGGGNNDAFCVGDLECPDGECVAPCPTGTTSLGFGTKCKPNCCQQPLTGADTCAEAPIVVINVPDIGQPPVTYTWTSNNKNATFGDRIETDPPTGTCNAGIFSEVGGTRDRGWWHAFSISDCADVRVDHCCTFEIDGRIHQPAWAQLWLDCNPCTTVVGGSILGPGSFPDDPIGTKVDPNARGGPFCDFDDLWVTYGPLPKGIYRYATYTASGGHFGVFQLHVTVAACVQAACCLEESVCIGGPLSGQVCGVNDDCAPNKEDKVCVGDENRPNELCCPGGACDNDEVTPLCVGGSRAGLSCCEGGGICKGNCPAGCTVLIETECDALGGFWMGFGNIPLDDDPVLSCDVGVCNLGSCCTGPGECLEDKDPNCGENNCCADGDENCMDKKTCLGEFGLFVGGSRCEFQKNPCPACQIEDSNNCHNLDGANLTSPSDLSMKPGGFLKADDIVLTTGQINQVCVWGAYFDGLLGPNSTHSCSGQVLDDFRVRFYEDDGNGKPDHTKLIAQAGGNPNVATFLNPSVILGGPVTSVKSDTLDLVGNSFDPLFLEVFTLTFSTMNIPTGVTVWLEVANNTDTPVGATDPQFNTCDWWWAQSQNIFLSSTGTGNEWAYAGTDYRPIGYPSDLTFNLSYVERLGDTGYLELGHDWNDQVFCLAGPTGPTNFEEPDAPTGTCCDCDNIFTDGQTLADCTSRTTQRENRWGRGVLGITACLPPGGVAGDDCGTAAAGAVASGLDCSSPTPQPGDAVEIFDGGFESESVCAGDSFDDCFPGAEGCLGGDFWTNYVTTCSGELVLSMCHSGTVYGNFDSWIAVYHDFGDPTNCPCPTASLDRIIDRSDEGCNGEADGGSGVVQGLIVFPGECYTARLGGWGMTLATAARGIERLDVGCISRDCFVSSEPTVQVQFGSVASAGAPETKNRIIAINAGDAGQEQAVRVTWDEMPNWVGGHELLETQKKWMTEPFQVCENSGNGFSVTPPNCGPAPGQPQKWFWAAQLSCNQGDAFYSDMTKLTKYCTVSGEQCLIDDDCAAGSCGVDGAIHIIDQGIAPTRNANQQAVYSVQVIEFACSVTSEDSFSSALVVTQPLWGDIGDGVGCPMSPPNGAAGLVPDVTAALAKFSNGFCTPKKTRADVEPFVLDMKVNITDVLQLLNAFSGVPYGFPAGPVCSTSPKVAQRAAIRNR